MDINDILWRNEGQLLTPELIVGILHGALQPPELVDNALINTLGEFTASFGGVTFQVERLYDILEDIKVMHEQQWNEVEAVREGLNPDYDALLAKEFGGSYVLFTARRNGELVGNTTCYLYRSMHNGKLCAKEDSMYLVPSARKGRTAMKFFSYCEAQMVQAGAREITVSVKTTNKAHLLWERAGYTWTDRVLTKTFEEGAE